MFDTAPVVALDPLLAESWQAKYPILDADRDLRRLHEALGLVLLDDPDTGVKVTPLPNGTSEELRASAEDRLTMAKPYLAAVAVANTPSREREVLRGLSRLEVVACQDLVLRYRFRGETIDRPEATSYIAVRREVVKGAIHRNIGTAHLEVVAETNRPDWYAFGPQLAEFLQVPTQGDAFAVLLSGSDDDRRRYLASRRIPIETVDAMREALNLPIEEELDSDILDLLDGLTDIDDLQPGPGRNDTAWRADAPTPPTRVDEDESDEEPLPPLDLTGITLTDVDAAEVDAKERAGGPGGGGLGAPGPVDHDQADRRQREIGRRGERVAFDKERERVHAFGGDPAVVRWRSQHHPFAPYDIESIDEDGQRIYIEVKATTGEDPSGSFTISQAELLEALRHRSCFYIYRVTSTATATPQVHRYRDPAHLLAEGRAALHLADARLSLGKPGPGA